METKKHETPRKYSNINILKITKEKILIKNWISFKKKWIKIRIQKKKIKRSQLNDKKSK